MNCERWEGCRWQTKYGTKPAPTHTCIHMHTMDTNPEILMPMVGVHWKLKKGGGVRVSVCEFKVFWQITHTPLLLVKKVVVEGYPILAPPLSPPPPPPLLSLCMHISHSHRISPTVGPGQHIYTDAQEHTPFCHTSGAWTPGREKERRIHSLSIVRRSSVGPVNRQGSSW